MWDSIRKHLRGGDRPLAPEIEANLEALANEARAAGWDAKLRDLPAAKALLGASPEEQIQAVHGCFTLLRQSNKREQRLGASGIVAYTMVHLNEREKLAQLAGQILKRSHPFSDDDLSAFLDSCSRIEDWPPAKRVVSAVERTLGERKPTGELRTALEKVHVFLSERRGDASERRLTERVARLLSERDEAAFALEAVDAWTAALGAKLDAMSTADRQPWLALLAHCALATSSKPSKKWLRAAEDAVAPVGEERFAAVALDLLATIGEPAPFPVQVPASWRPSGYTDGDPSLVSERFGDTLRGLVWALLVVPSPVVVTAVGDAADRCFEKIRQHGPRAPKVGNACLHVLGQLDSPDAVAQITRLRSRVKHASVKKQIGSALDAAADRAGLTPEELEERAVPSCDLSEVGVRTAQLGDYTSELRLLGVSDREWVWTKPDGKTQKSVPAEVKREFADEFAELKRAEKELRTLVPAQRDRIERALLSGREWAFEVWRERYLDHPVVGFLARRLIWRFGDAEAGRPGAWLDGRIVDVEGRAIEPGADSTVSLWHPIDSPAATVLAWREWLLEHGVTQPFKQAHREIYRLTDAERTTAVYSNRFAAHILKQHQFSSLCQQRGWRHSLQGAFDSHNTPTLELLEHGVGAKFLVDAIGSANTDVSEAGIYLYASTDQLRFYRLGAGEPLPLEEVPRIVFSEVMRDVDLFVGVSSIGSDPHWQDGGPEGYVEYWTDYAFGELAESALTRLAVLKEIVPQLKIADRCSLDGRHLSVRGDRRRYHIHIGSGNVKMDWNDQYLCIVPGGRSKRLPAGVRLPFEGDAMLSIILSKAFLLAADAKIDDPTILAQIEQR